MKFSYIGNQENKDVRIAGSYANSAFSHANAAFLAANTSGGGSVSVGTIAITVDNFTSNGNTTTYTLSTTPTAEQYVTVGVDGLTQFRNTYNTSGNIITFDSVFENGANIEVTTITSAIAVETSANTTNAAFAVANSAAQYANAAFVQANAAFQVANSGSGGTSAGTYANAAFIQANTAIDNAASASLYANAAFLAANSATGGIDTWVRDAANAASSYANSAYTHSAVLIDNSAAHG